MIGPYRGLDPILSQPLTTPAMIAGPWHPASLSLLECLPNPYVSPASWDTNGEWGPRYAQMGWGACGPAATFGLDLFSWRLTVVSLCRVDAMGSSVTSPLDPAVRTEANASSRYFSFVDGRHIGHSESLSITASQKLSSDRMQGSTRSPWQRCSSYLAPASAEIRSPPPGAMTRRVLSKPGKREPSSPRTNPPSWAMGGRSRGGSSPRPLDRISMGQSPGSEPSAVCG